MAAHRNDCDGVWYLRASIANVWSSRTHKSHRISTAAPLALLRAAPCATDCVTRSYNGFVVNPNHQTTHNLYNCTCASVAHLRLRFKRQFFDSPINEPIHEIHTIAPRVCRLWRICVDSPMSPNCARFGRKIKSFREEQSTLTTEYQIRPSPNHGDWGNKVQRRTQNV